MAKTGEGKEITWRDLQDGAESIYKKGIGFLDHLAPASRDITALFGRSIPPSGEMWHRD
ncbi:MAG: hypothetical protein ACYCT9_10220 [Leptospirillum sp.]